MHVRNNFDQLKGVESLHKHQQSVWTYIHVYVRVCPVGDFIYLYWNKNEHVYIWPFLPNTFVLP